MIEEENEKIAICPVCLDSLTTDLYFISDDCLYHKKSFSKSNFESPISKQDFLYYFPVNKLINDKIHFEKEIKNNFEIIYGSDGYDQDGFNRKGFDRNGFDRKGIDKYGYNINKELASQVYLKKIIGERPNTYHYATLRLKHNVDLAIFFLEQGRQFSLTTKYLR